MSGAGQEGEYKKVRAAHLRGKRQPPPQFSASVRDRIRQLNQASGPKLADRLIPTDIGKQLLLQSCQCFPLVCTHSKYITRCFLTFVAGCCCCCADHRGNNRIYASSTSSSPLNILASTGSETDSRYGGCGCVSRGGEEGTGEGDDEEDGSRSASSTSCGLDDFA